MSHITATSLQNVLNTVAWAEYQKTFARQTGFLGTLGITPWSKKTGKINYLVHKTNVTDTDDDNAIIGSMGEDGALPTGGAQGRTMASWDFKIYGTTVSVTGLQQAISENAGVLGLNDILVEEITESALDLQAVINGDLITSDGSNAANDAAGTDLDGIEAVFKQDNHNSGSLYNIYGGITRLVASTPWWFSYENDLGTSVPLTVDHMRTMKNYALNTLQARPDAIWCNPTAYDMYEELVDGNKRNNTDTQYGTIMFDGIPLIPIPGYTEQVYDFVQTRDWGIHYLPQKSRTADGKTIEGGFKVEQLGRTKDAYEYSINIYANMYCKNPFKQMRLKDFTTPE